MSATPSSSRRRPSPVIGECGPGLRPGSAIAVGVVGLGAGLVLLVPGLLHSPRSWSLISTVVLGLVLIWLFVVRPSARLGEDGIRLVNPMRTVEITWPAIEEVRSRWALEVFSDGRKYTAWGLPADPGRPRYGRSLTQLGSNRVAAGKTVPQGPVTPKVDAQTVATEIEAAIRADRSRNNSQTPRIVVQVWDPIAVGLLVAAVAFFVLAAVVFRG